MADPAGLALALLGAFNDAIRCFEYVQLARNFDQDYQTATLKLDVARLRLSRWGVSVGLNKVDQQTSALPGLAGSPDELEKAKELLDQIAQLFGDAERQAARLRPQTHEQGTSSSTGTSVDVYDADQDLDQTTSSLHQKLERLSLRRFKPSNMVKKAKWALHKEKFLNRLIQDTSELIDGLIDLFPSARPEQTRLCTDEGAELAADDHASVLVPIAEEQDPELGAALKSQRAKQTEQMVNVTFAGSQNYGLQQGYFSGHQTNHFGFGRRA